MVPSEQVSLVLVVVLVDSSCAPSAQLSTPLMVCGVVPSEQVSVPVPMPVSIPVPVRSRCPCRRASSTSKSRSSMCRRLRSIVPELKVAELRHAGGPRRRRAVDLVGGHVVGVIPQRPPSGGAEIERHDAAGEPAFVVLTLRRADRGCAPPWCRSGPRSPPSAASRSRSFAVRLTTLDAARLKSRLRREELLRAMLDLIAGIELQRERDPTERLAARSQRRQRHAVGRAVVIDDLRRAVVERDHGLGESCPSSTHDDAHHFAQDSPIAPDPRSCPTAATSTPIPAVRGLQLNRHEADAIGEECVGRGRRGQRDHGACRCRRRARRAAGRRAMREPSADAPPTCASGRASVFGN